MRQRGGGLQPSYLWHSRTSLLRDWGGGHLTGRISGVKFSPALPCPALPWPRATKRKRNEAPERPTSWSPLPNCVLADRVLKIVTPLYFSFF
jgi:hypothetical protein